jgi:hypothetical protein
VAPPAPAKKTVEAPPQTGSRVFISYRRSDSIDITGRIYDKLVSRFGADKIFKDVDTLELGMSFTDQIHAYLKTCSAGLVIVGPSWTHVSLEDGTRRLEHPSDYVRTEVRELLKLTIPVIPVFVGGREVLDDADLPEDIRQLAYRHGIKVRPDPDFHNDMDVICRTLSRYLAD